MKAVSLFSGAGGMDLGAELAGIKVIYANDNDADSCETYSKNFPDTTVVCSDVKELNLDSIPKADILLGGYPCQSFSLGGNRDPEKDERTYLYLEYAKVLSKIQPKFFIAENVSGLTGVKGGKFFNDQLEAFQKIGPGYVISRRIVDAKEYGVPQSRRRVLLVGVRKDLNKAFIFPEPTHGKGKDLLPYSSHGDAIKDLPLDQEGDYYHRPHDPDKGFSWYFMSRNRKSPWDGPAYTVVANWRHITLHPASPTMKMVWSDLKNGFKQKWEFTGEYEHLSEDPSRPILKEPRRLTWQECARIQTFPDNFVFCGKVESKFRQIGNAVPVLLAKTMLSRIVDGSGLSDVPSEGERFGVFD
ncbi:MAG: DNA cytosine methyltransferase [Pseudomonadales bacterium]|jgi:DNA (cytosine-5)-methyltransferase 1|nr:DNA cytosine methyltransferase [Pseudomonadales bacterium]